jgi:hypothetical protein
MSTTSDIHNRLNMAYKYSMTDIYIVLLKTLDMIKHLCILAVSVRADARFRRPAARSGR